MRLTDTYNSTVEQRISDALERDWANYVSRQDKTGRPLLHLYSDGKEVGNIHLDDLRPVDDVIAEWNQLNRQQVRRTSQCVTVWSVTGQAHHGCEVEA